MSVFLVKDIYIDRKKYWYDFMTGEYGINERLEKNSEKCSIINDKGIEQACSQIMNYSEFICLTIMTTSLCNFRCAYCFEEHKNVAISKEAIPKICKLVEEYKNKHCNVKRLIVIWFGGEPTLAVDFMLELNLELKNVSYQLGIKYTSRMITNGFLLDKIIPYINTLNLTDIQITLDGLQNTHDTRRIHATGSNTFNTIINNILKIDEYIDIIIRANVDADNFSEIVELKNYILELPINRKARVFFQPMLVENYGGDSKCYSGDVVKSKKVYIEYLNLLKEINNLERPRFIGAFCNVDFPNTFVLTSNGNIVKCWADIDDCEKFKLNIYKTDSNEIIEKFENAKFKLRYERCKKCTVFPACLDQLSNVNR